jgi:hypothetical protein
MKNHLSFIRIILVLMLMNFCLVHSSPAQEFVHFREVENIPPGKAVLYIFWPNHVVGGEEYVTINDQPASFLPLYSRGCLVFITDPGIYIINAVKRKGSDLVVQVKEGEKVFIQGIYKSGETPFRKVPEKSALREVRSCKLYEKQFLIGSDKIKSIAMISTTISEPQLPGFPGSDFTTNVDLKMNHIIEYEKARIREFRDFLGDKLGEYFGGKILFGDSLALLSGMKTLKERYEPPVRDAGNLPSNSFVSLSDDLVPFSNYRGDIDDFFSDKENYEPVISEIGTLLQADYISICNTRLIMRSADDFGTCGTIRLAVGFYLFRKDGSLVENISDTKLLESIVKGNDPESFKSAIDQFPYLLVPVLERLTYKLSKEFKD